MYASYIKGTTNKPHQLSTHSRKVRYKTMTMANFIHCRLGFTVSFFIFYSCFLNDECGIRCSISVVAEPETEACGGVSEPKEVAHGEQSVVGLRVFGGQHRTQGKAFAVVGIVGKDDAVGYAVVDDTVDAGHFVAANTLNG